jgi:hypothetical protein
MVEKALAAMTFRIEMFPVDTGGVNPHSANISKAFDMALDAVSGIDRALLEADGMSGKAFRMMLNNLVRLTDDAHYLEIGVWKGATFCSAIDGANVDAIAIDDFSQFGGPKELFRQMVETFGGEATVETLQQDFRRVDYSSIFPRNIYFFDGPHDYEDHRDAITVAQPALADQFILIVDDWNDKRVREGTNEGIERARLRVDHAIEIFTADEGQKPRVMFAKSDWHCGCLIAACTKLDTTVAV